MIYFPIFLQKNTKKLFSDWSIAVGYWIVLHFFSLVVNVRIRISVAMVTMGLTSSLQVTASFFLYHKTHTKNKKQKIKN